MSKHSLSKCSFYTCVGLTISGDLLNLKEIISFCSNIRTIYDLACARS